ncbi:hypothetical protein AB833_22575 [Chromatiales bacterium (ex Bugula neritina AB1)]|nr:hypothetical protein AB833_22575 [Chromatiales bacterium (ex Bugula neritina AB1)]
MKKKASYGAWPSSISTGLMVSGSIGLSQAILFDSTVYWLESRPTEEGRTVIMRCPVDTQNPAADSQEVLPARYNCRTRVHEYGGACYLPTAQGVYFVNQADQQIYRIDADGKVTQITNDQNYRFADFAYSDVRSMLVCVAEKHTADLPEPGNSLVSVDPANGSLSTLHSGEDFYASACFSPDGSKLAWLSWRHPDMPWDATTLWQADVASSTVLNDAHRLTGGSNESIFQPQWSPDGELFYVSDKSNWWNLYRYSSTGSHCLYAMEAEFGMPQWVFGMSRYAFLDARTIVTSYSRNGSESFAAIDTVSGELSPLQLPHSSYQSVTGAAGRVCYIAQSPTTFPALYCGALSVRPEGGYDYTEQLLCQSSSIDVDKNNFSKGESISYPTGGGQTAHGFFYTPVNAAYTAPADELPPLIVMIHGGPTSATQNDLSLKIQFWTNRGFAVLDVNYRGSTGFGRQYRDALKEQWGIADVEDCDYGVRYLVEQKRVDANRVAIRGGSAGGYTVLAALAKTNAFKAGASLYGVTDLTALATDTHKFESRYLDSLIGPYPEEKARYIERSPISHADKIDSPVIFLQGLDDKVVPPSQAESMIKVLRRNAVKVAYVPFEGEAHGFRKSENISTAFEAELWFYGEVFGFATENKQGFKFIG